MKIYIIILGFVLSIPLAYTQVGINTDNPQHILHIDAKKDNGTTLPPINTSDDVIITTNGNLGIGTVENIDQKVTIQKTGTTPAFRLEDGSQANKFVLTSDTEGNATWMPAFEIIYVGSQQEDNSSISDLLNIRVTSAGNFYTGHKIILSKGTWVIRYNLTWRQIAIGTTTQILTFLSTSATTANVVPGTRTITTIPNQGSYASTQMTTTYVVADSEQTLYMWAGRNSGTGQFSTYNPLVGITRSNMLEAVRW